MSTQGSTIRSQRAIGPPSVQAFIAERKLRLTPASMSAFPCGCWLGAGLRSIRLTMTIVVGRCF
jgi:hypothetical protein